MEYSVMKPLRRSIQSSIHSVKPPESDPEFEDICLDLFKFILKDHNVQIHNKISPSYVTYKGTKGDRQYGFDIKCKASLAVAQCKLVEGLYPSDLEQELTKLKKYQGVVSHYFFLISNDRVKSSLQVWVDEKNSETEEKANEDKRFPVEPAVRLPWFHIIGWTEIRNYLLESTLLSLKWGALQSLTNKYPYLHGLDISRLKIAVENIYQASESLSCSIAVSGCESLTSQLNHNEISQLGRSSRVSSFTLNGVSDFIKLYEEAHKIAQTYHGTLKKLESEDPITYEEGLSQLNTLSLYSARIFALQYLRRAYLAALDLNDILFRDEGYYHEETYGEEGEGGFDEFLTGYLLFNFSNPDENDSPWYINPTPVQESASTLVKMLQNIHIYQAE
ncbi:MULTISPECIES: hypothetical protein [unclassified Pseudomonas]|uniref:hypothetical protein n=1 Tax=unclassified Pseudomonas TaxID=196821 RepID=UPI001113CF3A|nr:MULTISPECIES: hypothetical protein [unclassified Pseudomonas]